MGLDGLHDPFFIQSFLQSPESFIDGITWSNFHGGHAYNSLDYTAFNLLQKDT